MAQESSKHSFPWSAHCIDHFFLSIPQSHLSLRVFPTLHPPSSKPNLSQPKQLSDHAILSLTIAQIPPLRSPLIHKIKSPITEFYHLLKEHTQNITDYMCLIKTIYKIDSQLESSFKSLKCKVEAGLSSQEEYVEFEKRSTNRIHRKSRWPLAFMRPWKGSQKSSLVYPCSYHFPCNRILRRPCCSPEDLPCRHQGRVCTHLCFLHTPTRTSGSVPQQC
jgi:hypothetical protein